MGGGEINELARRQIRAAAEHALKEAGAYGQLPTPLDAVAEAAGVSEIVDISELTDDLVPRQSRLERVRSWLGAYLFRADVAFVDFSQPDGRARFIEAHEIGHRIVPWHKGAFVDDERSLFHETEDALEKEASLAAAHLIFQGRPFFERAIEYPLSMKTPLLLADECRASLHATIRYYVEHHDEPVALVIAGRYPRMDGSVPIFLTTESASFRSQFGPILGRFPTLSLPLRGESPVAPLLRQSHLAIDPPQAAVALRDLAGTRTGFLAEAFFKRGIGLAQVE